MIRTYSLPTGWVVSDNEIWLPGYYDSEVTARAAADYPSTVLEALNARICHISGQNRWITMRDLYPLEMPNYVAHAVNAGQLELRPDGLYERPEPAVYPIPKRGKP